MRLVSVPFSFYFPVPFPFPFSLKNKIKIIIIPQHLCDLFGIYKTMIIGI